MRYVIAAAVLVVAILATVVWWGYQNHAAIERLEAAGVQMKLRDADGALGMFTARVESFDLGEAELTDDLLADISQAGVSPERLDLSGGAITDAAADSLDDFPSLKHLDVSNTSVGDVAWAELQAMDSLESLSLANTQVTEAALAESPAWQKIKELNLSGLKLTGEFLKAANDGCQLEQLVLDGSGIQLNQLAALKPCKQLTQLSLAGGKIDDKGLRELAKLGQVKHLNLSNTELNGQEFRQILADMQLTSLKVAESRAGTILGISPIDAPGLKSLDVSNCKLDDANIQALSGLAGLETLNLDGNTALTDEAVSVLINLKNLKTVHITNTRMPTSSAHRLYRSLPKAVVYYGNAGSISYLGYKRKQGE
ncbi:MAG: hypothetical protein R3352_04970 [Salinisphaeraceae bacterium]|nr:hypothetical protein [Salinisphaeraceae bacterium]